MQWWTHLPLNVNVLKETGYKRSTHCGEGAKIKNDDKRNRQHLLNAKFRWRSVLSLNLNFGTDNEAIIAYTGFFTFKKGQHSRSGYIDVKPRGAIDRNVEVDLT